MRHPAAIYGFSALLFGALLAAAEARAEPNCVPFARAISNVKLTGDAWSWWRAAEGRYRRSQTPAVGAVLVMKRTPRLRFGHVAVVSAVLDARQILLDHANWSPGEIARGERAIDVSPRNDWSQIRVWNDSSASYGVNVYPAHGFVHPVETGYGPGAAPMPAMRPAVAAPIVPAFRPKAPDAPPMPAQSPRRFGA